MFKQSVLHKTKLATFKYHQPRSRALCFQMMGTLKQGQSDTFLLLSPAESKTVMMQDTPATFVDCAAIFKSGNTRSGVYTLTLPNTTTEVKVE